MITGVAHLVEILLYNSEGSGFDSRWSLPGYIRALGTTKPLTQMSTRDTSWEG
jgi:hypothetical protein